MVSTHREALSLFNRDVRLVLFSQALIGFTIFGGVYTVLLNLYLLRLGYGPQLIGQVNAVGALSFAFLSMPAGLLANRWGARRSMIVGMIIAALGFGLLPLGEFAPTSAQLTWIMGAYALGVLGNTLFLVCSIPFLTLICPPRLRNHVFSTQVALWPLAGFAGSLCGGLLPGLFSALLSLPENHPIHEQAVLGVFVGIGSHRGVFLFVEQRPMLVAPDFEGRVGCHPAKPCLGVGDDLAAHTGGVEAQEGFLEDLLRFVGIGDDLIGHLEDQASVVLYGLGAYVGWSVQN